MTKRQRSAPTRRTVLSALGTGLAGGLFGSGAAAKRRAESEYVLVQGDECVPVQPVRDELDARQFYEYQMPDKYATDTNGALVGGSPWYSSVGTADFQRGQTSIAFLYEGPEGLSLVFVHGSVDAADGGSVSFQFSGLPEQGEWVVKDDLYRNPDTGELESYDRWQVDATDHTIDWTWGSAGTDGGVFTGLGDEFEVTIDPAFNEAAALYGQYYEGTVTDWQFLSGTNGDAERVSLDLSEPILITTEGCEGGASQQTGKQDQQKEQQQEQQAEEDQQTQEQQKQEERQAEESQQTQDQQAEESQQTQEQESQQTQDQQAETQQEAEKQEEEQQEEEAQEKEEEQKQDEEKKEEKEEKKEEKRERKEEKRERKEEKRERKEEKKEEKRERKEEKKEEKKDDDDEEDDDDDK